MEWIKRLNASIDYIERHLEGRVDYQQAAQIACCSVFHYQRMFSYIADIPLGEYIRRRRMTLAAFALQQERGEKVIDIALRYGYDSPTAFARAFKAVHGVSPSRAREKGVRLSAYPRIAFHVTIKGEVQMEYRIVEKEAFRIVGVKRHYDLAVAQEADTGIPAFWSEAGGVIPKLCELMDRSPEGILGVCTCMDGSDFDYYIAAATTKEAPEGMAQYEIPACTWAVFPCVGPMPGAIQRLQKRIASEWLPTSGYTYADAPDIECYTDGDMSAPDYRCEVWLPVVKK